MSKKTKRILTAVGMLMLGVLLTVVVSNAVGVATWNIREANEANLYQSVTFAGTDGVIASGENGVKIELTDDNEIKVKGTSETDGTYVIGKITLEANTSYIFDSSLTNGSNGTMYMSIMSGETELAKSYSGAVVFTPTSATEVQICLYINKDVKTNVTLCPVLCKGTTTGDIVDFWE
ncbi:MAG: hypothetical protein IJX39_06055 [Clostridia bacterium]|nr:hypothetical protein [Clostridia bacterium]